VSNALTVQTIPVGRFVGLPNSSCPQMAKKRVLTVEIRE